jgi:hypothetical protein
MRCIEAAFWIFLGALPSAATQALEWADGRLQLHGYLSQGAVYTTDNNFYGHTDDDISLEFREVGLNISARPFSNLRLSAQGTSRWAGEMDNGEPWLDFALADFTFLSDENMRAGIRLGRIKNPYGLYTETRDVAFTRPGIILPQPIYFDRTRKFALAGDGFHLYGEFEVPGGTLDARFFLVDLPINDPSSKAALFGPTATGDLEQDRMTPGFRLLYETANRRWRGAFTYASTSQDYEPSAGELIPNSHILIEPWIASLQYSNEQWTLTAEYSQRSDVIEMTGSPTSKSTAENWYVQAQYRFLPQWELLLRYDRSTANMDDPDGKEFAAQTGRPAFSRFARDIVAGMRYDVTPSFMLRAEYHHVDGTSWLSPLENPVPGDLERHWDMLMFLGSYHF